jgi:hypothetical protein
VGRRLLTRVPVPAELGGSLFLLVVVRDLDFLCILFIDLIQLPSRDLPDGHGAGALRSLGVQDEVQVPGSTILERAYHGQRYIG